MSQQTTYEEPTYGNWRRPRTAGIGRFGALETGLLIGGLLVIVVMLRVAGPVAGGIALVVSGVAFAVLTIKDKHNRSRMQRWVAKSQHKKSVRRRLNTYRSGPVGLVPGGKTRLPGLLAQSELHEFTDGFERTFAVLHMPHTNHATIVIEVEPTGLALDDRENIDEYVANWGGWLAGLSKSPDIVAASVTIETAPDYGTRLRNEIDAARHDEASAASIEMMEEVKASFPQESEVTRAWISVTFTTWRPGAERKRTIQDVGLDLGTRMGRFTEHLEQSGAGDAHPVTAQTLCEIVRSAYDPGVAEHIESAHANGVTPEMSWDDVGPGAYDAGWEWFRHDSGLSKSWFMSVAPRGVVYSSVLEPLLSPGGVTRKRVSWLFRPVSAAQAMDVAEADVTAASNRAATTNKTNFRAEGELQSAVRTAEEISKDAALINFGAIITATVLADTDARPASYEIEDAIGRSQLIARPAYGSQEVAFAASLPLGLVLPDYVAIPSKVREAL